MKHNADKMGSHVTQNNDSRITNIGKIMRKTSLDEIPQLLNILQGHMSFVGPRPDVPKQRELYSEEQWNKRLSVKPGITGLAQASIRSSGTHDDRTELDLKYVDSISLVSDIKIIFKTVETVLFGKNVN